MSSSNFCSGCGKRLHIKAVICPHCGVPTSKYREEKKLVPSRGLAIILAIFLGPLGIHRFFIGDYLTGILFLVISLFGICIFLWAVVWLINIIEAIYWSTLSEEDWEVYCRSGIGLN